MIRLLLILISFTAPIGRTAYAQTLSGQVYVMTEDFADDGCQPQIECDCCYSNVIFLTDKDFVFIDRCIHNDVYFRGTYTLAKEHLSLNFAQFIIIETYDDETEKTKIEKQVRSIAPAKLFITTCKTGNVVLQRTDLKVLTKAFSEPRHKADEMIEQLKSGAVWRQLF